MKSMKTSSYLVILIITMFSLFSNYKKFVSSIDEINIFNSVASSTFNLDSNYLEKLSKLYPNLGSSAIPLKSILGGYYVTQDSISKGIDLLKKANLDNPYLGYPDMLLARVYEFTGQKDSFFYYTNQAYNKLPNNSASYLMLTKKLLSQKKFDSLSYFFNDISNRIVDINVWQIYLAAMFSVEDKYVEYNIDALEVEQNARRAKILSDDQSLKLLADYIIYGRDVVAENYKKYEDAMNTFNDNPEYSIKLMSEVIDEIGDNLDFYEAIIEMYFQVNNFEMVVNIFSEMKTKNMTKIKSNILEMVSISYIYSNDIQSGCNLALLLFNNKYNLDSSVKIACKIIG